MGVKYVDKRLFIKRKENYEEWTLYNKKLWHCKPAPFKEPNSGD